MSSFHERQKDLFKHLKEAEDQCGFSKSNRISQDQDYNAIDRFTYKRLKREMKQFRGRESIYKRKEASMIQCLRSRTIPDHIKNPQKWQYYSLSDVTPDQMSDSTNIATALAFIREMEDREEKIKMEPEFDETGVFKKPTFQVSKTVKSEPLQDEKVVFKSNKIIMPEYVVGVTKKKEKKINMKTEGQESSSEDKKAVTLKHLYDEEEEE